MSTPGPDHHHPAPPQPAATSRWLGRLDYHAALDQQENLRRRVGEGERVETLLLLEHHPVYTIGRTKDRSSLRGDARSLPHPVVETNRGGQATFHGPGQLVGYPILRLDRFDRDLHRYLRFLEELLIETAARFGVQAKRIEGMTGIWSGDRKLASIGVGVRQWITMHGFAINVSSDLSGFEAIVPCGLAGVRMTSLSIEAGTGITVVEVAAAVETIFAQKLPSPAS